MPHNVFGLGEGGDFPVKNFTQAQKFIFYSKVQFSTSAPLFLGMFWGNIFGYLFFQIDFKIILNLIFAVSFTH
jgi:hypothetical protein